MKNRKLQQTLRFLHLWLGLIAGLFVVVMGLSGMIVVFRPYIESSIAPRIADLRASAGHANLAAVQANLSKDPTFVQAGAHMTRITFPDSTTDPLLVQADSLATNFKDKQRLVFFVNPASGIVLGLKQKMAWLDWTVDLHQNLLSGKTGRALTGLIGAALLLLSISGLISWLAGRRDWKRTLGMPGKGPWRRVNYEAHKWAGLWTNLLLIAVSLTGIVLAIPDSFRQGIRAMTGEKASPARPVLNQPSAELRPLSEYVAAALAPFSGGVVRELRLPNTDREPVSITLWAPGDARPKGTNVVYLDAASANVLSVERSGNWASSKRLLDLANAIHKTEVGGLPFRLLFAVTGLASVLLCLSGVQIWWSRRKKNSGVASRGSVEEPLSPTGELVHK